MKVETLLAALKTCRSAVKQRGIYPVFSCYCFADDIVFGYDDVVAIIAKCQTGLVAAIRGDILLGTIETFRGEVTLESKDDNVVIKSGKSTVKLSSMGPDTFLFEPPEDIGAKLELEVSPEFFAGLVKCAATVGDDAQHREFTAVCLSYADKRLSLYSSDDIRLSLFDASEAVKVLSTAKGFKAGAWLLSSDACQTIVDAVNAVKDSLTGEQSVSIAFGDQMGCLTAGDQLLVYFRWLDATPPKYAETVARVSGGGAPWVALPEDFRAAVRRAEVLTGKDVASALDLEVSGSGCKLALNADRGTRFGELSTSFSFSEKASGSPLKLSVPVSKLSGVIEAPKVSFSPSGVGFADGAYTCWVSPLGE